MAQVEMYLPIEIHCNLPKINKNFDMPKIIKFKFLKLSRFALLTWLTCMHSLIDLSWCEVKSDSVVVEIQEKS